MRPLRVEFHGGGLAVDHDHVVTIGRAADADVRLRGESVSRRHAELRPTARGWLLVDVGSRFGTWVGGERIGERLLLGPTTVSCGGPDSGATFTVTAGDPSYAAPDQPRTVGRPQLGDAPQTGPDLLVRLEDQERRFTHPAVVTIGRSPRSTMVVGDLAAARFHGRIDAVPGGWVYTNMSAEGTYHDGRRVETLRVEDGERLHLAHPVAGPELFVAPLLSAEEESRRRARRARGRRLKRYGAVAAAMLLVIGTVVGLLVGKGA